MFLHTWHPQPFILSLGQFRLHWYGLCLALGALAGYALLRWLAKREKISHEHTADLFVWLIIGGFIGARLYHVANEWEYYRFQPALIPQVWNGGLAIHGAVMVGAVIVWWFAKKIKISAWRLADLLVPALAIGQAIGRWGNYFNQELFGRPTGVAWSIPIDLQNRPKGFDGYEYFHPTFLYESLGSLVIAGLLTWLLVRQTGRSSWWSRPGVVTALYAMLAGALRLGTEVLRIDRVPIISGVRLPLIVAGLTILFGIVVLIVRSRSSKKV